jgi:hypothetical protein
MFFSAIIFNASKTVVCGETEMAELPLRKIMSLTWFILQVCFGNLQKISVANKELIYYLAKAKSAAAIA